MKHTLNTAISLALLAGELISAEPTRWVSPKGGSSFELSYSKDGEPIFTVASDNRSVPVIESPLIASPVSREFGGITWFTDASSKWIDERYLVFEAENRLALLDAQTKQMILNTSFEALSKDPNGDRWSAVRYRPIGRQQERLFGDFRDTLFVVDLQQVIKATTSSSERSKPFAHLKSLTLPGNALTKPVWIQNAGKERLAIGLYVGDRPIAVALNPETLNVIEQKVLSISLSDDITHSPWINREAEQEITKATLNALSESPNTKEAIRTSTLVTAKDESKISNAKSAPTKTSGYSSSLLNIFIALCVAVCGLLWLLLKRRSRK